MSKTLSFYNLTGGLNTVQDLATINSTPNRTESPDMMNIEYYKLGGIQTMKGNKQIGQDIDSGLGDIPNGDDILCGVEYIIGNNSYMICVSRRGTVYRYNKTNKEFVEASTSFSVKYIDPEEVTPAVDLDFYENVHIYGVSYNNGIVFVNGNEALYYRYDGTTETITVWTPQLHIREAVDENKDGQQDTDPDTGDLVWNDITTTFYPTCVASYKGRLFFGADKTEQEGDTYNGGMLFYSGVGLGVPQEDPDNPGEYLPWEESPNVGEDAGAFKEFFEDSSSFTGLATWAEYLVIHKQQNTYILNGTSDTTEEWELKPYSEYTIPSQQSYVIANNGYYSYIPEAGGIHSLLTRNIYNTTFQGGDLSYKIKDTFDYIDTLNYDKIFAVYHPKKKYIMFYMPMLDGKGSNKCYIYDIQTKTWLLRRVPQKVTCAFKFDNNIYIGAKDEDGTVKILKEFSGKTFDSIPIDFYYLTPPFIWGGGTNKTTTKEFRVKLVNSNANHFYIESFKDGLMDSKNQRLIKNVNDNLNGLIWDIGLAANDRTFPDSYESDGTYYHYVYDGKDYYTKEEIDGTNNPLVYLDATEVTVDIEGSPETAYILSRPSYYWNKFKEVFKIQVSPSFENPDIKEITTKPTYAWNKQEISWRCYSNGTYYAWLDTDNVCHTNITVTEQRVLSRKAFALYNYGTVFQSVMAQHNLLPYASMTASDYNNYWAGLVTPILANVMFLNKNYQWVTINLFMTLTGNYYYDLRSEPNSTDYANYKGRMINFYQTGSATPLFMSGINPDLNLASQFDAYSTNYIDNANGTEPTGDIRTYTLDGDNLTITINGTPTVLTRDSNNDKYKQTSDTNYWTRVIEDGSVPVWADKETKGSMQSGTISNGVLSYNSQDLIRYSPADGEYTVTTLYRYLDPTDFTSSTSINGAIELYNYPDDDDPIWEQTLTDTVWDEDAWLQQGYTTKRMLLPNQYFETVQFKFSGTNNNDSICISGFEVNGIQLAETPWR